MMTMPAADINQVIMFFSYNRFGSVSWGYNQSRIAPHRVGTRGCQCL